MDVHIDLPVPYEENYQIRMLRENEIPGLIGMKGCGRNGSSRYTYRVKNGISMEKRYRKVEMKGKDVENFLIFLVRTVKTVSGYLLNPDGIMLDPELIFIHEGTFQFCYLPAEDPESRIPLCTAFHQLTEYFLKKLDYHDTEGIFLVYKLHKETMKESFDIEQILDECRKEEKEYRKEKQQNTLEKQRKETIQEEDEDHSVEEQIRETMEWPERRTNEKGWIRKAAGKLRRGRWGEWQDLITEMDGQKNSRNL